MTQSLPKILDIALIINRYKNLVKQNLTTKLNNNNNNNNVVINFNDSLFNFFNKECIKGFEHMDRIMIIENEVDDKYKFTAAIKTLYHNGIKIFVTNVVFENVINVIKANIDFIACVNVLNEYYGQMIYHYKYSIDEDKTTFMVSLIIKQNSEENSSIEFKLLTLKTDHKDPCNDINFSNLFSDLAQLMTCIKQINNLTICNIKRIYLIFDFILNNSAIVNLNFFTQPTQTTQIFPFTYQLYLLIQKYINVGFVFPEEEFVKRLTYFLNCTKSNWINNTNILKTNLFQHDSFIYHISNKLDEYYDMLRNLDLDNKSAIYNYAMQTKKRNKINRALYESIKYKYHTSCYKEYNNFIRDVTLSFSEKFNKTLFYDNTFEMVVYFELPHDLYLRDMIYIKTGHDITLLNNVLAYETLNDIKDITNTIIQIKLHWYDIFLVLRDYGMNGVILPYGTQLRIDSITPLNSRSRSQSQQNNSGWSAYFVMATCLNTLVALKSSNINDFVRINRK